MVGRTAVSSSSSTAPLAPPSIYDAYPLAPRRSLGPPPPLERALSQQRLATRNNDAEREGNDAMGARRVRELFERTRADDVHYDHDDGGGSGGGGGGGGGGGDASSPMMFQQQRAERRSATMCSRFGKFTGEVYETKERSRMINVLKRRSHGAGGAGGASGGGGGRSGASTSSAATAPSRFTADDVLRAGMLTKQGSWRRNWKTRFFLLRRDFPSLSYYKSEEKLELLGAVPLAPDSLVLDKSAPGGHAPFRFQLRTDSLGAALLLETETRDNQQRWMDACQELVDALRAEKFRQSTLSVDRDPTTARSVVAPAKQLRQSMGGYVSSSALRGSVSVATAATTTRASTSASLLSTSAPHGGRIRTDNQPSHRDLRGLGDDDDDDSDASSDDETNQHDDDDDNQRSHHQDDDDDDDIWATGRSNVLVVLDQSTHEQNLQQIQQTQTTRRLSAGARLEPPATTTTRAQLAPSTHAPSFDLVLELALGRQSKLLTRSESANDKLRCCVKVVGYASATKRVVDLGTTDSVKVTASSLNPDGSASPVRVAFSVVLQADLDRLDQLRFTVYRSSGSSSAASSRATVGIGRCFVDEPFKTLGAPRLVALAEKSSSFPDLLAGTKGSSSSHQNDHEPSLLALHRKAVASSGSAQHLLPLDSNAIHLVVQAFPSLAPQHILPTSGIDMAASKYLLSTTLSSSDAFSSSMTTSPRDATTPGQVSNTRLMDNGSFLTSSSESVTAPHARLIVVDEILRAPRATFALPLAYLDFLEQIALERTRALQQQVETDDIGDTTETAARALRACELEFYRKKLEEYLRQRQFLMKQEKRLLDEDQHHRIFTYAAEQLRAAGQKPTKHGEAAGASDRDATTSDMVAPFKRSTYKSLDLWQFVATNMQDQFLCAAVDAGGSNGSTVAPQPFVWHTMTMGCPAAHTKGFASGGFPLTASVLEAARVPSHSASVSASMSVFSDDEASATTGENELFATLDTLRRRSRTSLTVQRTSQSTSSNPAFDSSGYGYGYGNGSDSVGALRQRLELKERLDIVASQALSAAVACLTASLDLAVAGSDTHRRQLANAPTLGFLVHFESLLSTQGKEVGMLEDFAAGAKWLRTVFVQFRRHHTDAASPYFSIKHYTPSPASTTTTTSIAPPPYVLVTMGVTDAQLAVLPPVLATGVAPLRVRCVLFTQGVNEKQSLVHALKSQAVKVQDRINRENLEELKEIYGAFRHEHFQQPSHSHNSHNNSHSVSRYSRQTLDDLLTQIEQHVCDSSSQFKKNVALLTDTSDFCRELGGARVTCCKSGKDRTAMSVTLEQTRLCCSRLRVSGSLGKSLCATMRLTGVRRKNVLLNTTSTKFAFNEVQRKMLPECYKPPQGTYKSGTT